MPDRGDVLWLTLDPRTGHEQSGRRPALVLSPSAYNAASGLAVMCPVTSRAKGYPYEVDLGDVGPIQGVVLADQVRSLDWRARSAEFAAAASEAVVAEVMGKLRTLVGP